VIKFCDIIEFYLIAVKYGFLAPKEIEEETREYSGVADVG
jgi:hypothetical protein